MKILILGADGMLGHQLVQSLRNKHQIIGSYRKHQHAYDRITTYLADTCHFGIEANDFVALESLIKTVQPDAVINAIGIVKQRAESKDLIPSIEINALLPHHLAVICNNIEARLVHLSTDCVFSGQKGMYLESDLADADDIYGRSKKLGEVCDSGSITLRTSIIGLELSRKKSLIEWFLAQKGQVKGYKNAIFSGFTTLEMARIIEKILIDFPSASGVYHVSSVPINKYDLLMELNTQLSQSVEILEDTNFFCERSLVSERFRNEFSYNPPSWQSMLRELADQIKGRYQ